MSWYPLPNPLMARLWIGAGHKRVLEWMLKHIKWGLILNLLMSAFLVASLKSSEYFFDVSSFPGPLWIGSEFRHLWIDLRTINYIWYLLTRSLEDKWYLESTYTISEWSEAQLFGLHTVWVTRVLLKWLQGPKTLILSKIFSLFTLSSPMKNLYFRSVQGPKALFWNNAGSITFVI